MHGWPTKRPIIPVSYTKKTNELFACCHRKENENLNLLSFSPLSLSATTSSPASILYHRSIGRWAPQHVVHQHDHAVSVTGVPPQPTYQPGWTSWRRSLSPLAPSRPCSARSHAPEPYSAGAPPSPTGGAPCSSSLSQRAVPACSSSMLLPALSSSAHLSIQLSAVSLSFTRTSPIARFACFLMLSTSVQFQHGYL